MLALNANIEAARAGRAAAASPSSPGRSRRSPTRPASTPRRYPVTSLRSSSRRRTPSIRSRSRTSRSSGRRRRLPTPWTRSTTSPRPSRRRPGYQRGRRTRTTARPARGGGYHDHDRGSPEPRRGTRRPPPPRSSTRPVRSHSPWGTRRQRRGTVHRQLSVLLRSPGHSHRASLTRSPVSLKIEPRSADREASVSLTSRTLAHSASRLRVLSGRGPSRASQS